MALIKATLALQRVSKSFLAIKELLKPSIVYRVLPQYPVPYWDIYRTLQWLPLLCSTSAGEQPDSGAATEPLKVAGAAVRRETERLAHSLAAAAAGEAEEGEHKILWAPTEEIRQSILDMRRKARP